MTLPIDRTTKTTLDVNLVNGVTSDAPTIKSSNDNVYNTIDELYNYMSVLIAGGVLQPYPAFLSRQAIINGNFDVWQRGTSFTNPVDTTFLADRWQYRVNADSGTLPTSIICGTQPLTSGDIPNSYSFYRISPNGSGTSLGANSSQFTSQKIENGTRLLCGAGKKVTVSFWAKSSIVGKKIGVQTFQYYGTGGSPTAGEILSGTNWTLTSTWTKYSFTFTTNTLVGKVFGTNNDDYLRLGLYTMWGSTTATQVGAVGAETFVGAGNIDIAQVQVNAGDQSLPFQPKSFSDELALCQRYYTKTFQYATTPANGTGNFNGSLSGLSGGTAASDPETVWFFPVKMRISPTITLYNPKTGGTNGQWTDGTNSSANARAYYPSEQSVIIDNSDTSISASRWWIQAAADAEL